jgi:hypothetical protein
VIELRGSITIHCAYQKALISVFQLQNNLCEFTTSKHKYDSLFCIENQILSIYGIQNQTRFGMANSLDTLSFDD